MENETNLELEPVNTEETGAAEETPKPKLTPEQEAGIKKRQFTRLAKELGIELPKKEDKPQPKNVEKNEFDDTEQLFLDTRQIPEEDRTYLFEEQKTTGKSLRQIIGFKYVQEELASRKSGRSLPDATNRTGQAPKDTLDYWLAKANAGEVALSQVPDVKIRKQIIESRIAADRNRKNIR